MKKVRVNKAHKKADLSDLMLKFKKSAFILAAGLNMAVFLEGFALNSQGAIITEESVNQENKSDDLETIQLPENPGIDLEELLEYVNNKRKEQGYEVLENVDQITVKELKEYAKVLNIKCTEETDLSWMNTYKESIQKIGITIKSEEGLARNKKYIENLSNLELLYIFDGTKLSVNEQNFGFIKNFISLKIFKLKKINYHKEGFGDIDEQLFYDISNMPNITSLGIPVQLFSTLDYKKFGSANKKLRNLYFSGEIEPGDIALSLTQEELDYLENKGIDFLYKQDLSRVEEINEKISQKIKEINFTDDMTDEEKRNEIVKYLCENLQYDSEVSTLQIKIGEDIYSNSEIMNYVKQTFYKDGYIYAGLEGDTQVCGNYAALFNAIAERVGLESYLIFSKNHAYNLVKIGEKYILVDPTFIDFQDKVHHSTSIFGLTSELSVVDEIDKFPEEANKKITWLNKDFSKLEITDPNDYHYSLNVPEKVLQAVEDIRKSADDNDSEMKKIIMNKAVVFSMCATITSLLAYVEKERRNQKKQEKTNKDVGEKNENIR